jgi:hypothetical protein
LKLFLWLSATRWRRYGRFYKDIWFESRPKHLLSCMRFVSIFFSVPLEEFILLFYSILFYSMQYTFGIIICCLLCH